MSGYGVYENSVSAANRINPNRMVVHKVHMPDLYVFAKIGENGKEWPPTFVHNERTFYFASNEIMPNLESIASEYSGYAKYEWKEIAVAARYRPRPQVLQGPVTHEEFGAYLCVLGTAMRNGNNSLHDVQEPRDQSAKNAMIEYIETLAGCDNARALFIVNECWKQLKAATFESVAGPDPE